VPADPSELRRHLNAVAMRQAGYFTAAQARSAGYSHQAQKYHVDHGNWVRVDRGLFRLPDWPAQRNDIYVLWRLWSRGHGVVSHQSALAIHDLSDVNPSRVHLTVPPGFRSSDPVVVLHRAHLTAEDIEDHDGYQVTTVERTLLDAARSDVTQEQLQLAVAEAVERGLASPRRLRMRSDEFGDRAALRIERALSASAAMS
jgi:predicted transcriptional regulator of viral defense system